MNKREACRQVKGIKLCFENAIKCNQESCKAVALEKLHSLINEAPPSISYDLGCIHAFITNNEDSCDIRSVLYRLDRLME
jgi:hypothetical protein